MSTRRIIFAGTSACALALGFAAAPAAVAGSPASSSGHGTYTVTDDNGVQSKRQFSFSATQAKDGRVTGNAQLKNPAYDFTAHIQITCLSITGNKANFGGWVTKSNDPTLGPGHYDRAFFTVVDNGEPGSADTISGVAFDDTVNPDVCPLNEDFGQTVIEGGNVQVRPAN